MLIKFRCKNCGSEITITSFNMELTSSIECHTQYCPRIYLYSMIIWIWFLNNSYKCMDKYGLTLKEMDTMYWEMCAWIIRRDNEQLVNLLLKGYEHINKTYTLITGINIPEKREDVKHMFDPKQLTLFELE